MKADDFTYDNETLSSRGFIIASLGSGGGEQTIDTDSQRTFTSASLFYGKYQPFICSTYEDRLELSFSIIKNPCDNDLIEITQNELRDLKRWLNRPNAHKLSFNDPDFKIIFWNGSFNLEEVYFEGVPYAVNLRFISDRPFAYEDECAFTGELGANESVDIYDKSDDEGYLYPTVVIKCLEGGDLTLTNDNNGSYRETVVKNCVSGEILTFSSLLQITSSVDTHKLGKDFNYKFLRLGNAYTEESRINTLTSSLPIVYDIRYYPIVKAVIA